MLGVGHKRHCGWIFGRLIFPHSTEFSGGAPTLFVIPVKLF
jgi:hypothetical protein